MYVKCGHCIACQMEKANARLRRIKNSIEAGTVTLFVTLTYAPKFLPYIKPGELSSNMEFLNIYRDYDIRKVRKTTDYDIGYETYRRQEPIETLDCFAQKLYYHGERLPRAHGSRNKIGVLFYKDLQDFCKRLERNLYRHYGIPGSRYKMYKISEYGETYYRPHFHFLIHIPPSCVDQFFVAIRESWPFDNQGLERQIEFAKNASSYVSKYLCRGSDFPKFFENRCFAPKASFSKGFGLANPSLSLPALLASVERGNCTFTANVFKDGKSSLVDLFYPKYFINRYFFKFKGYSRLAFTEILQLVRCPLSIYSFGQRLGYTVTDERDDYRNFLNGFRLRFERFCRESQIVGRQSDLEYYFAYFYYMVWSVYASTLYRNMFALVNDRIDMLECYDNLQEVRDFNISHDLQDYIHLFQDISDPNLFRRNVSQTCKLENDYFSHIKRKRVTNMSYRRAGMKI